MNSQGYTPATIRGYLGVFRLWERWCNAFGMSPIEASVADVARWLAGRRHLARSTVRNSILGLRAYYRCVRSADNPAADFRLPRVRLKPVRPYSQHELGALLDACRTLRDRAMLLVLLATGLRASEMVKLTAGDFDGSNLRLDGKGGKVRLVPPGMRAADALASYTRTRTRACEGSLWGLKGAGLTSWLRRLSQRAGVKGANLHRFRHTFAADFCEAGGSEGSLQVLLGHSSLAMSLHYAAHGRQAVALEQGRRYNPADRLVG